MGADNAEEMLDKHLEIGGSSIKGVRQNLNWLDHPVVGVPKLCDRDLLSDPSWRKKMELLQARNLSFEIHFYPHQAPGISKLVSEHPNVTFVINHLGCPLGFDEENYQTWKKEVLALAAHSNVNMKLSGVFHPFFIAKKGNGTKEQINGYVHEAIKAFGASRCMFGSNFPVDRARVRYQDMVKAMKESIDSLGLSEDDK